MSDSEFAYIKAAMEWKFGILIGIAAWQTAIRFVMVFISSKIKELIETSLPADREWVQRMFNHRIYRIGGFILNALLSIRMPAMARKGDTTTFTKPKNEIPPGPDSNSG